MKLTDYLGDKPFWRVTVKLAVPVALQNVLTSSFQLVDTLMVSQLGDVTLSAVGMAAQWGWLCGLLGFGLCSGMSVFISQYWGVKDLKGIRRVMGIGLMLAMLVSLGFLAVALAAGIYLGLGGIIGKEAASWLCLLAAAPVAIAGFFHYNGMTLEQFLWAFIKSEILCAGPRRFDSVNLHEELFSDVEGLQE